MWRREKQEIVVFKNQRSTPSGAHALMRMMVMVGVLMRSRRGVITIRLRGLLRIVLIFMSLVARAMRRGSAVLAGWNTAALRRFAVANLSSPAFVLMVASEGIWQCQAERHSDE